MKNIKYFWPLGALGRFLQLARSCHRITLIEPYPLSSTSHCTLPCGRDSHDLLCQQSGNVFLRSKLWWIIKFSAVCLDCLIFSILTGFGVVWLSISISWLNFLPGAGSRFNFHEYEYFFTWMSNFRSYVKVCKPESSAAFLFLKLAPRWGDSYYIIVSTSGFDVLIECTDFMYVPIHFPKMKNIIIFGLLVHWAGSFK